MPSFLCLLGLKYWSSVFWCKVRGSVVGSIPVGKCPSLKNFFKLSWIFSHKYLRVLYLCMLHLQLLPPFHLFRCFGFKIFFATYPFEMNLRGLNLRFERRKSLIHNQDHGHEYWFLILCWKKVFSFWIQVTLLKWYISVW